MEPSCPVSGPAKNDPGAMSLKLTGQSWMAAPETGAVMAALAAAGGADCARFVGGCVRNTLMGLDVADVDIATTLRPEQVVEAAAAANLKSVPTGLDHGTVTLIAGGRPFEVTTLRRDVTTDGRNATVAYTSDWAMDAQRRDFTFNALYADMAGKVFDPVGGGIDDARAGRVVFVGDAQTRIREDYLRILRFFRFLAWYGKTDPEPSAVRACADLKEGMRRLSAERVSKELLRLLGAPDPVRAVELMEEIGVLALILPQARDLTRFRALAARHGDPLLRLAALIPDAGAVGDLAARLRLSNAQAARIEAALGTDPLLTAEIEAAAARRALYAIGAQAFCDRLKLTGEDDEALITLAEGWSRPRLPIAGEDVAALGVKKGPKVGEALRAVEAWWIESDFPDDRRAALAKLSEVVGRL
jgi:poly(A) polymerase